jgi:hypothetical protein
MQNKNTLLLITFFFLAVHAYSQDTISKYVNEIRKEFNIIQKNVSSFDTIRYSHKADKTYGQNIDFTGYINNNQLVILTCEELIYDRIQMKSHYYFKNNEPFFLFVETNDKGNLKEERYYFYDNKLIEALIKTKDSTDNRLLSRIPNRKHQDIINHITNRNTLPEQSEELKKIFYSYPVFPDINDDSTKLTIIRKEHNNIKSSLPAYSIKEVNSTDQQYSYENREYKGYFDSSNHLVLLTFYIADEGYGTNYEYYFKEGQCFYIFRDNDWEPINEKSQEFVSIYNGEVISFLIKKKTYEDETPFSKIKAIPNKDFNKSEYTERPRMEKNRFLIFME